MNMVDGHPVPRSLLESYNLECSAGKYSGSLADYVRLQHLIFRTKWREQSPLEAPGLHSWMRRIAAVDECLGAATDAKIVENLKNFRKS